MKKYTLHVALALVFAIGAFTPTPHAEAALISTAQITEQRTIADNAQHNALEERLKLVQMLLVQVLEQRIDQLKAQIESQK
jgi:ABC-type dipeptide/oligopeptide/nickel transport system permease component